MSEDLYLHKGSKEDQYNSLVPQIKALVEGENNLIANMANISAALKAQFNFLWVGFYLVEHQELVLGPFQGPIACTRIGYGKGVCGLSWQQKQTLLVPDVEAFPGHIACSSLSKSEIVVPVFVNNIVFAVLDVDSEYPNFFDDTDQRFLEIICQLISHSEED